MAVFRAFKPTAMNKIAQSMGYTGDMGQFQDFIEQDPARQARMKQFTNAAMEMAKGGVVKMQQGGTIASQANYGTATGPRNNRAPMGEGQPVLLDVPSVINTGPPADPFLEGAPSIGELTGAYGVSNYIPPRGGLPGPGFNSGVAVPLALTGGQPGGATPVMNDPRGVTSAQQPATPPAAPTTAPASIGDVTTQRMYAPGLPQGGVTTAALTPVDPRADVQQGTGALTGAVAVPTAMAQTAQSTPEL